jgi:hypothetical protein
MRIKVSHQCGIVGVNSRSTVLCSPFTSSNTWCVVFVKSKSKTKQSSTTTKILLVSVLKANERCERWVLDINLMQYQTKQDHNHKIIHQNNTTSSLSFQTFINAGSTTLSCSSVRGCSGSLMLRIISYTSRLSIGSLSLLFCATPCLFRSAFSASRSRG